VNRTATLQRKTPMRSATPLRRATVATAAVKVPRAKKCKGCGVLFTPARPMQRACNHICALDVAREVNAAAERKRDQAKREQLRTAKEWKPIAQAAFNRYIRLRDAGRPCICCDKPMEPGRPGGAVDAGHYLSSAPNLRFDERNVHAQRKSCNRPGGTTRAAFRAGMIRRIGLAAVEALEADQAPKHYTADDLKTIRDTYRRRARELEKA
jgi:hypothetical protein